MREIIMAPVEVVTNLYRFRHILLQLVGREVKGRFAGSAGGLLWNFIHPILMVICYLFVFVYIFKLRVGSGGGTGTSAIYLMAGIFPWIILAEGFARGSSSILENANLVQKTFFPIEILTTKAVLAPFLSQGIALILLTGYRVLFDGYWRVPVLLPWVLILQIFFTLGITYLSATLTVFFRDTLQLVQVVVSFWVFLTPIFYSVTMLPTWAQWAMYGNPVYPFIGLYQSLFIDGVIGQWHMLFLATAWSLLTFLIGAAVFNKLKYEFADWL